MSQQNASRATIRVLGSYAKALVVTAARIPEVGETLIGHGYRETYGGKGSDMAVQAARLGARVDYVGVVGADPHGQEFADLMAAEAIDISQLRRSTEAPTGVGLIIKDQAGHNVIVIDKGANDLFSAADLARAYAASTVPPAVVLAQLEIPLETALRGLQSGRSQGTTTILNPAPAVDLRGEDLSDVDVLTPNETEARTLLGRAPSDPAHPDELAAELLALGPRAVIITLGEQGARVYERTPEGSDVSVIPAWPVEVVDSNGAGDSFNAALAVALAEGRGLAEAASFGCAVAALCCEGWETVPSYRNRGAVDAFLATHDPRPVETHQTNTHQKGSRT